MIEPDAARLAKGGYAMERPGADGQQELVAGKYRIVAEVGRGGMGVVYRAEDTRLKRPVALKFLSDDLSARPEARARFLREAQAAAGLDNPHVCAVYEAGEHDGRAYIAMAFVEGGSLKERIAQGPLTLAEALTFSRQIAEGLAAAHDRRVVHRDIKPANIMLAGGPSEGSGSPRASSRGGRQARITDFGLARVEGSGETTRTGGVLGTLAYMSPEQAQGLQTDQRTDIWSVGCCDLRDADRPRAVLSFCGPGGSVRPPARRSPPGDRVQAGCSAAARRCHRSVSSEGPSSSLSRRREPARRLEIDRRRDGSAGGPAPAALGCRHALRGHEPGEEPGVLRRGNRRRADSCARAHPGPPRRGPNVGLRAEEQGTRRARDRPDAERRRRARRQHPRSGQQAAYHGPADQRGGRLPSVVGTVRPGRGRHLCHPGRAVGGNRRTPQDLAPRRRARGPSEAIDWRSRSL